MIKGDMGSKSSRLWIINKHPKRGDTSGPMSSSIGRDFVQYVLKQGIKLEEIHFDYIVNKVPPVGQLNAGLPFFAKQGILEGELASLKAKIIEYKPNLVFGLGRDVLYHLLGESNVNKWRGHIVWSDELQTKVMVTYDEYAAYQQRKVHKEQKPGQYWTLMQHDIRKAVLESTRSTMSHAEPKLIVAPSVDQCISYLNDAIENAKIVSYDIEVFEPYEGRLMDCIGLCTNTEEAICIPFYTSNPDRSVSRYFKYDTAHILGLVKKLLESNIPKVAQNSQFDTTMLEKYYGIKVKNLIWDTMVFQHNMYCDLPKDLGTLISLFTDLPYHKYMIHQGGSLSRWQYNAADAVANLHVMQGQIKNVYSVEKLPEPDLPKDGTIPPSFFSIPAVKHYYGVTHPTISSCVYMHIAGVKVDMDFRDKVISIERGIMAQLLDALAHALDSLPAPLHKDRKYPYKFNPLSPKQKAILFYDILGCTPVKVGGKVKADKNAIKKLCDDRREYVATLAKACLEVKAADARLLKFKVDPDNGYIRTQYDVTGTDTGRLASKESDVMRAGTNLQNIAKGPQRQMLIPEDGEEFALVDLYAAEAYLNALDAGEIDMLRSISGLEETNIKTLEVDRKTFRIMSDKTAEHYKIHNWMQRTTQGMFPEQCEKYDYTYKDAKQTIHGLNYNVRPEKMSIESGLPHEVTQWQYAMYHQKYPGIKARMARINGTLRRTKSMTSFLGRRRFFLMDIQPELFNIAYAWPSQSCIGEITEVAQNYLHLMSDLYEAGKDVPFCRPVLNTHDGLAIRIKKGMREAVTPYILRAFNIPLTVNKHTIVIPISIGFAPNFNDMESEQVYFYPLEI